MSRKKVYTSVTGYGVDVSCHRVDDLDRSALEQIKSLVNPKALDIGCGLGGQSLRMVQAGALVTAIDTYDFSELFSMYCGQYSYSDRQLSFFRLGMQQLGERFSGQKYAIAMMQRVLHYVPYITAKLVLKDLRMMVDGYLYLSVSGVDTAIAQYYPHKGKQIEERFSALALKGAEMFSIQRPLCLYQEEELKQLLVESGWVIACSRVSDFGNIKVICV